MSKTTQKASKQASGQRPRKPQQARGRARYEHVLDVTEKLIVEKGYDAVNTNAIAAAAGISVGSLYHYFPDKIAVLTALTERFYERYLAFVKAYHEELNPDVSLGEYVSGLLQTLETFAQKSPALTPAFLVASLAVADLDTLDQHYNQQVAEVFAGYYRQVNPALDPATAEAVAAAAVMLLGALFLEGESEQVDLLTNEASKMLAAYLKLYL